MADRRLCRLLRRTSGEGRCVSPKIMIRLNDSRKIYQSMATQIFLVNIFPQCQLPFYGLSSCFSSWFFLISKTSAHCNSQSKSMRLSSTGASSLTSFPWRSHLTTIAFLGMGPGRLHSGRHFMSLALRDCRRRLTVVLQHLASLGRASSSEPVP